MIPQKQGTSQFIGSCKKDSIVAFAISGSSVSTSIGVTVDASVAVGNLTVTVGIRVSVLRITGVNVEVGIAATVADDIVGDERSMTCVGCIVGLAGTHPVKAKTRINRRKNSI